MIPRLFGLFFCCCLLNSLAFAGGRPCWDDVPPAVKYKNQHVITNDVAQPPWTHSVSVDGLQVLATLTEVPSGILVELMVMNCSSTSVQVSPSSFDLVVNGPSGDKVLTHLDPTHFHHSNGRAYLPLRPTETLQYGQSGTYQVFFAPDSSFANGQHTISFNVGVGPWKFTLIFRQKRTTASRKRTAKASPGCPLS
jgi:hypothetical protein